MSLHQSLRLPNNLFFFFFQAEDGIRDLTVTGVQTCALPICDARTLFLDPGRRLPAAAAGARGPAGEPAPLQAARLVPRGLGGRLRRRWVGRAPRREEPAARRDDLLLAQEQEPGREARHPRRGWPADPEPQ